MLRVAEGYLTELRYLFNYEPIKLYRTNVENRVSS